MIDRIKVQDVEIQVKILLQEGFQEQSEQLCQLLLKDRIKWELRIDHWNWQHGDHRWLMGGDKAWWESVHEIMGKEVEVVSLDKYWEEICGKGNKKWGGR